MVRGAAGGCREYRMHHPAVELRKRGHEVVEVDNAPNLRVSNAQLAGWDVLILQKVTDPGWFRLAASIPDEIRPQVVYEIDDAVWAADPQQPDGQRWRDAASSVLLCLGRADAVTVSTPALARECRQWHRNVHVVPNCLDLDGRNWRECPPRATERVVIGWAGGSHHWGDEVPMVAGLRAALARRPGATFCFFGDPLLGACWREQIGRPEQWTTLPPVSWEEYPSCLSLFDIGVAPLADTPFNQCKSDLRLLEYGAWGVPYVASDIEPYRRWNDTAGGGHLAGSPKEWERGLLDLIDREGRRRELGGQARKSVYQQRGPAACGAAWERALLKILGGKGRSRGYLAVERGLT